MNGNGINAPAGAATAPALQVIVLGAGGGPQESNTAAFLVRSTAEGWRRGSIVAVDAGVLLSSITRILERTQPPGLVAAAPSPSEDDEVGADGESEDKAPPPVSELSLPYTLTTGPFAGLEVPYASAEANAAHIQRALVDTYLITHPHLDHISGFVVNTAGLSGTRPKRLAGLPSTIQAFKTHIFNNIIWPNLSDENNGVGLVTYMRLVDGGSPALGDGAGRGYVEISDGLAVKVWGVSHGHCIERHSHRGSGTGTRFNSIDAGSQPLGGAGLMSPRVMAHHHASNAGISAYGQPPAASSPLAPLQLSQPPVSQQQQPQISQLGVQRHDSLAMLSNGAAAARRGSLGNPSAAAAPSESVCVYDSSAYFMRDVATGREVLMFGDVEPDSVSLSPRNAQVWQEAAPKIAAGYLAAIFIECSYDDSQPVDRLYGHLTPRYVAEELGNLAAEVEVARVALKEQQKLQKQREREGRKRKRHVGEDDGLGLGNGSRTGSHSRRKTEAEAPHAQLSVTSGLANSSVPALEDPVSPKTVKPVRHNSGVSVGSSATSTPLSRAATSTPHILTPTADLSLSDADVDFSLPSERSFGAADAARAKPPPLQGVKVVIIHVKETLRDGASAGETILEQLQDYEANEPLGCEYIIAHAGQSLFF